MEKRDILLDEIEKLSIFLKQILNQLLKLNNSNNSIQINNIFEDFRLHFNISLNELSNLNEEELKNFCSQNNFKASDYGTLAEIFVHICQYEFKTNYLQIALYLLNEENNQSDIFSQERNDKINKINNLINRI